MVDIPPRINTREVVRGIIMKGDQILLMYSEKDRMYGTPGGAITLGESKLDALHRELLEEIGATQVRIIEHLGSTEEIRESRSSFGQVIRIVSDYYHVDVLRSTEGRLEEHEEDMGLVPTWMGIDEAIAANESVLQGRRGHKLCFYDTQTALLQYVRSRFGL
jgi:ADP-ribose pyrophosphatase YjhB (NUDIX family)